MNTIGSAWHIAALPQIGSDHVGQDAILRRIGNPPLPVLNN
jgi:hypothetical protein